MNSPAIARDGRSGRRRSPSGCIPGTAVRPAALALGLALSLSAAAAAGRDLTALPLEALLDLEVSTASRFIQSARQAPSAVRVITAAEIRAHGWRTLGEALASLPGLFITYDRAYTYLGARGFLPPGDYASRFLLLVDGHRFNDPLYGQAQLGTDFTIDMDLIERIEYVPGPGSAVYGSNAYFGVINVLTRNAGTSPGTELSAEAGSVGSTGAIATYGWQGEGNTEILISASDRRRRGRDLYFPEFDDGGASGGVARDLDGERARRVLLKGSHGAFTLALSHGERTKDIGTASYGQAFGVPGAYVVDDRTLLDLGYRTVLGNALEVSGHLSYGRSRYWGDYPYDIPPVVINHDGSTARWIDSEWKLTTTAVPRHKFAVGIDLQHDIELRQYNYDADPYQPYLDDRRRGDRIGLFVEDEFAFTPDLLLNTGLRYDHVSGIGGSLSPRLALVSTHGPATFKAIAGSAFRAPNAYERYYFDSSAFSQLANPNLEVERLRTLELIATRELGPGVTVGALLYRYRLTDLITPLEEEDGSHLSFRNDGDATSTGAEVSLDSRFDNGVTVRASYSYADVQAGVEGVRPANSPRHLAKLNALVPLIDHRVVLALEAQHVGERRTRTGASAPDYRLVNVALNFPRLAEGLALRVGVHNVFAERYAHVVGPELVQETIEQDGRSVQFKLSYRF